MKIAKGITALLCLGVLISCLHSKGDPNPLVSSTTISNSGNVSSGNNTSNTPSAGGCSSQVATNTGDSVCFNTEILPLIVSNCATSGCHDAKTRADGYELTSYATIVRKGIVAGNPLNSKLYQMIVRTDGERMPPFPAQSLPKTQTDLIAKWITQGAKNVNCAVAVDTQNITFSKTISPMIKTNCVGCHNTNISSGGVNLDGYVAIKAYVDNKKLYGAISYQQGYVPMPPANKMTDCQILALKKWIDAGALNN